MVKRFRSGIPYYEFLIFQRFHRRLRHAVLTRKSDILDNTSIQQILQANAEPISFKNQQHGVRAWVVEKTRPLREGDILISVQKNTPLVIRIADCASIQLFDPKKNVIANIHAGWRGLTKRVIERAIYLMQKKFAVIPRDIFAGISPMIGPCCSRFSNPQSELPAFLHRFIMKNNYVNLWDIVESQLDECGVTPHQIENPRICTACTPKEFHSYRRDKENAGRFGTAIMLC